MAVPEPRLGLMISYAYLWHHEHRAGRDEGVKNRPCVIILSARDEKDGTTVVRVAPVTHRAPDNPAAALELPQAVKRHLVDRRRRGQRIHVARFRSAPNSTLARFVRLWISAASSFRQSDDKAPRCLEQGTGKSHAA
jgi:hypothetical protein